MLADSELESSPDGSPSETYSTSMMFTFPLGANKKIDCSSRLFQDVVG